MTYDVGFATCDITPPIGVCLAGYAGRNEHSTGVYLPLRATVAAIDDGMTPVLIVMAEWIGFYDRTAAARDRISRATGIEPRRILLSGTHTHCGPSLRRVDAQRQGSVNETYVNESLDRIAAAAGDAWRGRRPGVLRFTTGRCALACCRRRPDPDNPGKVVRPLVPYRDGIVDHDISIITVESPARELQGVIFSYACHPTSRKGLLIGGDYVGFALRRIEANHPGAVACFLQGCAGDVKPRPLDADAEVFPQRDVEQVREIGEEFADAVTAAIGAGGHDAIEGDISVSQQMLELRTEPLDQALAQRMLNGERDYQRAWAKHHLDAIARGEPAVTAVPFELQTIRFGDTLALVAMAGEMTVEYALRMKREFGQCFSHVLPIGYVNGIVGYIPVKRQIPEGGYEVWDSNMYYKRTGPYVAATEDQIVAAAQQSLGAGLPLNSARSRA